MDLGEEESLFCFFLFRLCVLRLIDPSYDLGWCLVKGWTSINIFKAYSNE